MPKPRIGIVCLSAVPDDPRVRRQGDLFADRGWDVIAFGLPGSRSAAPSWPYVPIAVPQAQDNAMAQAVRRTMSRIRRLSNALRARVDPSYVIPAYWQRDERFAFLVEAARQHAVDIWLANDWATLPIVQALAVMQGVPYAYDTHELAVEEYAQHRRWRILHQPTIAGVEREGIRGAAVTSCVSEGIAARLQQVYQLTHAPLVIRNMPHYEPHASRCCGEVVEVLYHGVVSPGRGLETCIESVALWRPEFRLTIRGPASPAYLASLEAVAERSGVKPRVAFAPPVPMIELVREASLFDIGLFALPGHSEQNVHVLPNKFFEYTMAGLALCVSDLPEMAALLRQHDLGRLIPEVTPQAIAAAINGFDHASIDAYRRRALEAAKVLNWEAEAGRLFAAVEQAVVDAAEPKRVAAQ